MTTSGASNGLMTAEQMIQAACEELGYLAAGEQATGEDVELGMRQLNWMLKSMTARGVNLWREEETSVTVPAGQASAPLDASIENVLSARIQVNQGFQRELYRYERGQYFSLPNKATPGVPTAYYVDRQRDGAVLYLWPVPVADDIILLDVSRAIQDVTLPDQTVDVPQKWTEALYCALASRLAGPFGVTRTDPATAGRIEQRAAAFEQLLLNEDRPASIFMGPAYGEPILMADNVPIQVGNRTLAAILVSLPGVALQGQSYQLAGVSGGAGATIAATTATTPVSGINGGAYLWDAQFTGTSLQLRAVASDGVTRRLVATATASGTIGITVGQGATLELYNPNASALTGVYSSIS